MNVRLVMALAVLAVALAACQKQARPPVSRAAAPPPTDYFKQGEELFGRGEYNQAIGAYETYLRENPEAANGDLVLTRLAFAYGAPRNPERDLVRATAALRRIIDMFPDSPWRPYAEHTLDLQSTIDALRSEVAARDAQIENLKGEIAKVERAEASAQSAQAEKLRSELRERDEKIRRLTADVESLEERLRKLTTELDALKKIDLERRPAKPPN
jgi:outer membrane protein assembly factor BamD (BamD/ComL family)